MSSAVINIFMTILFSHKNLFLASFIISLKKIAYSVLCWHVTLFGTYHFGYQYNELLPIIFLFLVNFITSFNKLTQTTQSESTSKKKQEL